MAVPLSKFFEPVDLADPDMRHVRWDYSLALLAAYAVDDLKSICLVGNHPSLLWNLAGCYPHAELVVVEGGEQCLVLPNLVFCTDRLPEGRFSFIVALDRNVGDGREVTRLMDRVEPQGILFFTSAGRSGEEWKSLIVGLLLTGLAVGQKWEVLPKDPDYAKPLSSEPYPLGSLALRRLR